MSASTPATPDAPAELPRGRQFAVTWGIPDDFGGMTASLLHRSRAFVRLSGARVDILTFDSRPDYELVRASLHERGELIEGLRLLNIYEHFRLADRAPAKGSVQPAAATRPWDDEEAGPEGSVRRWLTGKDARVEHRRSDGTLAVLEEQRGRKRRITSFDRAERVTGQWTSLEAFRFAWLDELTAGQPAIMIVDSKTAARTLQRYQRPHVTLIHMVHGSHHDREGRLTAPRRAIFENLHRWDAVVFLTDRQRRAVIEQLGDTHNLAVVPNAVAVPDHIPRLPPDRLHGVIVSRMSALKRLDHALRIVAAVRALDIPVTVEIVGDGSRRAELESLAGQLGLGDAVRFSGYIPHGADRYAAGSWTLLTSRSEGEAVTILEAMAAGCLPVAYDIRYGPAEVIADERNGRLVPDGDIEAASRALIALCLLEDDALAAMRRNARKTAQGHDDRSIVVRWAEVQRAAVKRRQQWASVDAAVPQRVRVRRLRGRLLVTARMAHGHARERVDVRLSTRTRASTLFTMHRFGRWRYERLSREASAQLDGGPVKTRFLLHIDGAVIGVDGGTQHPDPRSLAQRVTARLRRGQPPSA